MKKQVAAWIIAAVMAAGTTMALAEGADDQPVLTDPSTEVVTDPPAEIVTDPPADVVEDPPADVVEDPPAEEVVDPAEDPAEDATEDPAEEAAHPDNHGALVSEAAHDHSHDAECGNHGRYVSSVARGGSCAAAEPTDPVAESKASGPTSTRKPSAAGSKSSTGRGKPTKPSGHGKP